MIRKAIQLAEEIGARAYLGSIYISGMLAALELDDLDVAYDFISRSEASLFAGQRITRLRFSMRKAFYLFRKGYLREARYEAEQCVEAALGAGSPLVEMYARILLAYVLRLAGEPQDARRQLDMARAIVDPLGVTHAHYLILLTKAILAFEDNNRAEGLRLIEEAFEIGARSAYDTTFYFWWQPVEMARLCAEALTAGIAVGYAKEVVRRHRLIPAGGAETLPQWPWPVRIYTLGRFSIEVNGKPLAFSGKVQKRPLALLKALVALSAEEVPEYEITDLLWPEAEGDAAHAALKTVLSRLRRLIGVGAAIEAKGGSLSLSKSAVWVDAQAFDTIAEHVSRLWKNRHAESSGADAEKASLLLGAVYRGDFLKGEGEPWVGPCREKLRDQYLQTLRRLADIFSGKSDLIASLYDCALDAGFLPDEIRRILRRA